MSAAPIAGLILAGGASRRMGTPKALLPVAGETFLDRLIGIFAATCDPVIVVLGHDSSRVRVGLKRPGQATFTINPDPDRGMLSSLQCGLGELPVNSPGVMFTPVDYPSFQAATLARIEGVFRAGGCEVVIPKYGERNGHPVCVSRRIVQELLALPASAQARDVLRLNRNRTCFLDLEDAGILADVDTPADYAQLVAAQSKNLDCQ